jgi:hypothetical protein
MAAHITAASKEGPRYNAKLTPAQRRHFDNGIWMCVHHGTLVDKDKHRYTVTQLRRWKKEAEARAQRELENTPTRRRRPTSPTRSRAGRPNVVYVREKSSTLWDVRTNRYLYYLIQVWFRNEPARSDVVGRSLTAHMTFLRNGQPLFHEIRGEWAIANAGDNMGFFGTRETLHRLPPTGEFAKLIVLHKRISDDVAYAWSRGGAQYPDHRHPSQQIPPGTCDLRIRIRGIKIDSTFSFTVANPGAGGDPTIQFVS